MDIYLYIYIHIKLTHNYGSRRQRGGWGSHWRTTASSTTSRSCASLSLPFQPMHA